MGGRAPSREARGVTSVFRDRSHSYAGCLTARQAAPRLATCKTRWSRALIRRASTTEASTKAGRVRARRRQWTTPASRYRAGARGSLNRRPRRRSEPAVTARYPPRHVGPRDSSSGQLPHPDAHGRSMAASLSRSTSNLRRSGSSAAQVAETTTQLLQKTATLSYCGWGSCRF